MVGQVAAAPFQEPGAILPGRRKAPRPAVPRSQLLAEHMSELAHPIALHAVLAAS